jgi:Sir2- and TIR-associating SLOG family
MNTHYLLFLTLNQPPMACNRKKTVFISGSAYEYGWFGDEGRDFIRSLSASLLRNDFNIITGFGSGVGNYVVEGALHEIYGQEGTRLTDQLRVFPFPTPNGFGGHPNLDRLHRSYRDDIISQAGIAVFLFGNKLEDIAIREADGMRKEFEIARTHGILVIPVGVSGYISAELWKDLVDHYDDYFNDRTTFEWYLRLGNPDAGPAEWIDAILQIANSTHVC